MCIRDRVLHIDIDPAEINKNIKVYHQVIGDSTDVMKKLIKLIPQQSDVYKRQEYTRNSTHRRPVKVVQDKFKT